ncbi:MAG: hypothetical protein ACR2GZ_10345 [Solirubrobacteraceae bacterium]
MAKTDVISAVQSVFLVAAPLAAIALLIVLRLPEIPFRGRQRGAPGQTPSSSGDT